MRNNNYLRVFFILLFLRSNAVADANEQAIISTIWYELISAMKKLPGNPFMRLKLFKVAW
jgi:hypothetical protein